MSRYGTSKYARQSFRAPVQDAPEQYRASEGADMAEIKSLVLDTWAGRRYYAVELVGQTPKKTRVRVLTPGGVMLPGRRYVNCGETVLVPKHAVVDLPKDTHKVEVREVG